MPTLDEVIAEAQSNGRVCPQPSEWNKLYDMLPDKRRKGSGWEPSLPLILAAWWDTPTLLKMVRLREHLEWAEEHGCLDQVAEYLGSLTEEQWHHLGE